MYKLDSSGLQGSKTIQDAVETRLQAYSLDTLKADKMTDVVVHIANQDLSALLSHFPPTGEVSWYKYRSFYSTLPTVILSICSLYIAYKNHTLTDQVSRLNLSLVSSKLDLDLFNKRYEVISGYFTEISDILQSDWIDAKEKAYRLYNKRYMIECLMRPPSRRLFKEACKSLHRLCQDETYEHMSVTAIHDDDEIHYGYNEFSVLEELNNDLLESLFKDEFSGLRR